MKLIVLFCSTFQFVGGRISICNLDLTWIHYFAPGQYGEGNFALLSNCGGRQGLDHGLLLGLPHRCGFLFVTPPSQMEIEARSSLPRPSRLLWGRAWQRRGLRFISHVRLPQPGRSRTRSWSETRPSFQPPTSSPDAAISRSAPIQVFRHPLYGLRPGLQ